MPKTRSQREKLTVNDNLYKLPGRKAVVHLYRLKWIAAFLLVAVECSRAFAAGYGYCEIPVGNCRSRADSGDVVQCWVVSDVFAYMKPQGAVKGEWNLWLGRYFDRLLDYKDGEWVAGSTKAMLADRTIETDCPKYTDQASAERQRDEVANKQWRTAGMDGIAVPWHPGAKGDVDEGITASRETSEHPNPPGKRWYLCKGIHSGSTDIYVTKFLGTQFTRQNDVLHSYGQQFGEYLTENKLNDAERRRGERYSGSCRTLAEEREAAIYSQIDSKGQHLVEMTWFPGHD